MSRAARLGALARAWVAGVACVLPACSSNEVVLATLPTGDDAGTTPIRCSGPSDCPAGLYCEKPACGAPSGTCQLSPAECAGDLRPVCGCDGVTYFNECLRMAQGVSASTDGPCFVGGGAFTCGGPANTPCPQGAACAIFLGPGPCPPQAEGSCWVIPAQCPASAPDAGHFDAFDSCEPGGPKCQDLCSALAAGGPHRRASRCF